MSELRVGGSVNLKGHINFQNMDIGGTLKVEGDLEVSESIRVSGSTKISNKLKAKRAEFNGSLEVEGDLEVNELTIRGSGKIANGLVEELDVEGSLKANTVRTKEAKISGEFKGTLIGGSVEVDKKSKVKGRIVAKKLIVRRESKIDEAFVEEAYIERGAEISRLSCIRCTIGRGAWIGTLYYAEEYRDEGAEIDYMEKVDEIPELNENNII